MSSPSIISQLRKAFDAPSTTSCLRREYNKTVFTNLSPKQLGLRFCIWTALKFESINTTEPYHLVSKVIRTNNWFSLYWEGLQLLKKNHVLITSDSVRALIRSYSYAGYTEQAIESFARMRELGCEPDTHTYNTVIRRILSKDMFMLALALYNVMLKSNCVPNEFTYSMLIHGFCRANNIKGALEVFDEMQFRDIVPDVVPFNTILSCLCRDKKVDQALRLVNVMKQKGCHPDSASFSILLDGFCKMGRLEEALSFVRSMETDGIPLQVYGYGSILRAHFNAKRYREAHAWFGRMIKVPIMPDLVLYNIMIHGLSQEGRFGEAFRMLDEMTQNGITPDATCYNSIIKGFCSAGLLHEAKSLYLEISKHDQFHDSYTHTLLISAMCKNGMVTEARKIFDQMEKYGCDPSVLTFNAFISGLCKTSNLEEANLLLHKMLIGRKPLLFYQLSQGSDPVIDKASFQKRIEQMCEAGKILDAYKLLTQLADSGVVPDIVTYNTLINGFCRACNMNGAFKLFQDMQTRGLSPDNVTYGTLINGLYMVKRDKDAFKICKLMLDRGCEHSLNVCRSLMTWSCRRNKVRQAFTLYLEYLKSLPGRDNGAISALGVYFVNGNIEQAIRGLLELDFRAGDFKLSPYTILLIGFCQAKQPNQALVIFSVLNEFDIRINGPSIAHLIKALSERKQLDAAVYIFLYSLDKGFFLAPHICVKLLQRLLYSSEDRKENAVNIICRMKSSGYLLTHKSYKRVKKLVCRYFKQKK